MMTGSSSHHSKGAIVDRSRQAAAEDPDSSVQLLARVPYPAGPPLNMAPELFEGAPATAASDVYSLGVLLFNLAAVGCGRRGPPWRPVVP